MILGVSSSVLVPLHGQKPGAVTALKLPHKVSVTSLPHFFFLLSLSSVFFVVVVFFTPGGEVQPPR